MPARTAARTPGEQPCPGPLRPAAGTRPPHAFLDLGAVPTAPGCARAWTREILREWRLASLSDTVELIVTELVTNSVTASRGLDRPVIRLILTLDRGELGVLVRDRHPGPPRIRHPRGDEENGRGLLLVQALSDRSGWYPLEDGSPGKVVWAVCGSPELPAAAQCPARPPRLTGNAGP